MYKNRKFNLALPTINNNCNEINITNLSNQQDNQ